MYVWAKLISHKYMRQFIACHQNKDTTWLGAAKKRTLNTLLTLFIATTKLRFVKISLLHL